MRVSENPVWAAVLGLVVTASVVGAEKECPPASQPGQSQSLLGGPKAHDEGSAGDSAGRRRAPGEFMDKALKELNLGEEQKAKIKAIRDQTREARLKFMAEHKEEMEKLHQQFKAARESGDRERMKEFADQMRAAREKSGHNPRAVMEEIKKVLTAEQAQQFEEQIKKGRDKVKDKVDGRRGEKGRGDGNDLEKKPHRRPEHPRKGDGPAGGDDDEDGSDGNHPKPPGHRPGDGPPPDGAGDQPPPPHDDGQIDF